MRPIFNYGLFVTWTSFEGKRPPPADTNEENEVGGTVADEIAAIENEVGDLPSDVDDCLEGSEYLRGLAADFASESGDAVNCEGKTAKEALTDALRGACSETDNRRAAGHFADIEGDDWIDRDASFKNHENANCAFQEMLGSSDGLMCDAFSSYIGGSSKLDLFFYVGNTGTSNGTTDLVTTASGREAVAITLSNTFASEASQIEITKVILHELVHADLLHQVKTEPLDQLRENNPSMMYYYDNYGSNWQHEYMANQYRGSLEFSLRSQFGPSVSDWQLRGLVWNGLHRTDAFKAQSEVKESDFTVIDSQLRSLSYECD